MLKALCLIDTVYQAEEYQIKSYFWVYSVCQSQVLQRTFKDVPPHSALDIKSLFMWTIKWFLGMNPNQNLPCITKMIYILQPHLIAI